MRIALVILHADPARGGAERYTVDLASSLAGRGHDVSILASSFGGVPDGVKSVVLRAAGPGRLIRYGRFLESLDRAVATGGYDVVHAMLPVHRCDFYHPHAGVAAEAVANSGWLGRFNLRRQLFAVVEKYLLTLPAPPTVLCLSDRVAETVRQFYPAFPADHLVKLFNGIDLKKFGPADNSQSRDSARNFLEVPVDKVVGLIMAQDFERKGLRQAIEALPAVPDVTLLVGGRPDPAVYRALAEARGVADRVRFAGAIADPVSAYHAADFFVLPTSHDPCSLVVLEALCSGVPVISTRANGACEAMTDGVHGRVLDDPFDVPALAAAMNELCDPARRPDMAGACFSLRAELSQASHVDRLIEFYFGSLSRRRPVTVLGN